MHDLKDNDVKVNNSLININIEKNNDIKTTLPERFYDDAIKPAIDNVKFFMNFLTADIKPYMYAKMNCSKSKIELIDKDLRDGDKLIPEKNKVEPRLSIVGPAIDALKYKLDEEYIRKMFVKILVSEIDNRKQNKVFPVHVEIIRQISNEEALFITELSRIINKDNRFIIISMSEKYNSEKKSYAILNDENNNNNNKLIKLSSIVVDNLKRLQFIEVTHHENSLLKNDTDLSFIKKIDKEFKLNNKWLYNKEIIKITNLGRSFIEICCS